MYFLLKMGMSFQRSLCDRETQRVTFIESEFEEDQTNSTASYKVGPLLVITGVITPLIGVK